MNKEENVFSLVVGRCFVWENRQLLLLSVAVVSKRTHQIWKVTQTRWAMPLAKRRTIETETKKEDNSRPEAYAERGQANEHWQLTKEQYGKRERETKRENNRKSWKVFSDERIQSAKRYEREAWYEPAPIPTFVLRGAIPTVTTRCNEWKRRINRNELWVHLNHFNLISK